MVLFTWTSKGRTSSSPVPIRDVALSIFQKQSTREVWREKVRNIRADSGTCWWWWYKCRFFKYMKLKQGQISKICLIIALFTFSFYKDFCVPKLFFEEYEMFLQFFFDILTWDKVNDSIRLIEIIITNIIIISLLTYSFRVFHIRVSWLVFTEFWVTASLLKSPGLVLGFWLFSAMLSFG